MTVKHKDLKLKTIFAWILILRLSLSFTQSKMLLQHVEPMNWWTGMNHHQVQVMLHGENIARFQLDSPNLPILGVIKTENPNYLFVTIETEGIKVGKYPIRLIDKKKVIASYDFELKERIAGSSERKGFSTEDVIYLLMPDRFANGNPNNDSHPSVYEKLNRNFPGGRHGGDIEGIIKQLDYIKELGATCIWTTPILEDNDSTYSYHTYGQSDLYKIDPRYGTNQDFVRLVDEAHKKGLKVIKDEVPNHWGYMHWMMQDLPTYEWIHQFPGYAQSNYRTSTVMDQNASDIDKKYCSDGWFVRSMPDLNQSNPLVLNYLIQNTIWWVEFAQLDGIRVDTYSYNDKESISKWSKAIMDEYPNLNMVGEVWMHDQAQISYWQKDSPIGSIQNYDSNLPSVMDFTLHDAYSQAFNETDQSWDKGLVRFYENFVNDFLYKDPNNLLIFFENHDTQRFNEIYPKFEDYKLATALLATTRGIPQIYYGSEIGMRGDKGKGDADVRRDFPGGWNGDSNNAFLEKSRTQEQIMYFDWTKKLFNWRKGKAAIHHGKLIQFIPQNNVYVYFRQHESETIMVILNNSLKEENIDLDRYNEVIDGFSRANEVFENEKLDLNSLKSLSIPSKSARIFELK